MKITLFTLLFFLLSLQPLSAQHRCIDFSIKCSKTEMTMADFENLTVRYYVKNCATDTLYIDDFNFGYEAYDNNVFLRLYMIVNGHNFQINNYVKSDIDPIVGPEIVLAPGNVDSTWWFQVESYFYNCAAPGNYVIRGYYKTKENGKEHIYVSNDCKFTIK